MSWIDKYTDPSDYIGRIETNESEYLESINNYNANNNDLKNLKSIFSSGTIVYTEISLINGDSGTVWINSFGGIEKHEVQLGEKSEKLYINDGNFLGMVKDFFHLNEDRH